MNDNHIEAYNVMTDTQKEEDRERQYRIDEESEDTDSDELTPEQLAEKAEFQRDAIREEEIANSAIMQGLNETQEALDTLTILPKMMGKDYEKFFDVVDPEQAEQVRDDIAHDHARDNSI